MIGFVAALATACSSVEVGKSSDTKATGGSSPEGIVGQSPTDVGSVALQLDIGPGTQVTSIDWTITNGTNSYSGVATIGDAQSAEFTAGGIAAGSGYTVTVSASDSEGDPCTGTSAPFSVSAGVLTQAVLAVVCAAPPDGSIAADVTTGTAEVDASFALGDSPPIPCPGIGSFSISPAEINTNQTAALSLSTVGPAASVTWSVSPAGGGTFGNANATSTTFACLAGGPPQVTLTATVGLPDSSVCTGKAFTAMSAFVNCEPQCTSAAGCPSSPTACRVPVCSGTACGFSNAPEGTSCSDSGGTVCNGIGVCVPFTFEVARIGTGTGAISANTTAVFLEQRRVSDGSLVATVALPTAAVDAGAQTPITTTGTSVTEGDLTRSVDGRYLSIAGFAAPPGVTAPSNSTTLDRVIARVDASGNVDTSTVLGFMAGTDVLFGGGMPRGAASVDGSGFWVGGTGVTSGSTYTGGIWFVPFGPAASSITTANQVNVGPTRTVRILGGQLYGDGDTTQTPLVFTVGTGLPTTGPLPAVELPGLPTAVSTGAWSFVIFDLNPAVPGLDTLYLAASTALASGDGGSTPMGILKFTFDGSKWNWISSFGPSTGARGLAGLVNPATNAVTLIASTVETGSTSNHVEVFVDTGTSITTGPAVQSTTNTLYRGVAISPHN